MMQNLWKREKVGDKMMYIDLCKLVKTECCMEVHKQLQELASNYNATSSKSNEKSSHYLQQANQFYQQSDFESAAHNYTKALCYAEIGTANVSMAFANRAQCFFRMQQHDLAMIDIDLALNAGCNKGLMSNIQKLQDEYQKVTASEKHCLQPSEERPQQLDFDADKNYPCLANPLKIMHNNEFGRHIVSSISIDVGKIVLVEESFASVVPQRDEHMCYTCLAESKNFITCPHCTDVIFCNEKCMNANLVHRLECHTIYHKMEGKVQFIIRTILVALTAFPSIENFMAFVDKQIELEILPESITDAQSKYSLYLQLKKFPLNDTAMNDVFKLFQSVMAIPSVSKLFDSEQKQRFLKHLILHHLAVNINNGYESQTTTSIGLVLCLFNHSCAPNLFNYAVDNKKFCVTIRPVKKGDQLFISYLGQCGVNSAKERKNELKSRWNFECKCDKCEPHGKHIDINKMRQDPSYKFISRHYTDDDSKFSNTPQIRKKCIKFLQKFGNFPSAIEVENISNIYTKLL